MRSLIQYSYLFEISRKQNQKMPLKKRNKIDVDKIKLILIKNKVSINFLKSPDLSSPYFKLICSELGLQDCYQSKLRIQQILKRNCFRNICSAENNVDTKVVQDTDLNNDNSSDMFLPVLKKHLQLTII